MPRTIPREEAFQREGTMISYADFEKVEMRVGRVVGAEQFPEARRPVYRLTIDLGPLGLKRSSAQITNYSPDD